jgi:hypothetical protein
MAELSNDQMREVAMVLENDWDFYRDYIRQACAIERRSYIASAAGRLRKRGDLGVTPSRVDREHLMRYFDKIWDMDPPSRAYDDDRRHLPDRDFYADDEPDHPAAPAATRAENHEAMCRIISARVEEINANLTAIESAFGTTTIRLEPGQPGFEQITKPAQPSGIFQESTMSQIITIRTVTTTSTNAKENEVKTYVNGSDIKNLTTAQIYGLISDAETLVETLSKIKSKPLQLQAEIEAHKAGVASLVAHLDERYLAENPDAKPARKARAVKVEGNVAAQTNA